MTIAAGDAVRFSFVGNGVTTSFPITSKFFEDANLIVWNVEDETDPLNVQAVLNTDYTVTGAGEAAGGTVDFVTAPANGNIVTVIISPSAEQVADYQDGDDFPADAHEAAMDRIVRILQRHEDILARVPKIADYVSDVDLPDPDDLLVSAELASSAAASAAAAAASAASLAATATTDNAIARFNGVNGALQNSVITIDDSGNLLATLSDNGAAIGPLFDLYRLSTSPAASDVIGGLRFSGRDSAANKQEYGTLYGAILDATSGSEDGQVAISTLLAGASVDSIICQGNAIIRGTARGDNASAGYVGEVISSMLTSGSAISLTTATGATVTSISLTAGDWDVYGHIVFVPAAGTSITILSAGITQTAATVPSSGGSISETLFREQRAAFVPGAGHMSEPVPAARLSLAATTTVYLTAQATFTVSTMVAYGGIWARRAR